MDSVTNGRETIKGSENSWKKQRIYNNNGLRATRGVPQWKLAWSLILLFHHHHILNLYIDKLKMYIVHLQCELLCITNHSLLKEVTKKEVKVYNVHFKFLYTWLYNTVCIPETKDILILCKLPYNCTLPYSCTVTYICPIRQFYCTIYLYSTV